MASQPTGSEASLDQAAKIRVIVLLLGVIAGTKARPLSGLQGLCRSLAFEPSHAFLWQDEALAQGRDLRAQASFQTSMSKARSRDRPAIHARIMERAHADQRD
jgi:hypothetical protein